MTIPNMARVAIELRARKALPRATQGPVGEVMPRAIIARREATQGPRVTNVAPEANVVLATNVAPAMNGVP